MATKMTPEFENVGQPGVVGTEPKLSVADVAKTLDLGAMAQRNTQRKEMKATAPAAPWYVTGTSYRGMGIKYEVKRKLGLHLAGQSDMDETILPGGTDKPIKEFVAFCRNDAPENDIDELITAIHRLAFFEAARNQLAEYVQVLEAKNAALDARVDRLEKELTALEQRRVAETTHLENLRVDQLAALENRRVNELNALENRRVSELAALENRRVSELTALESRRVNEQAAQETRRVTELAALEARRVAETTQLQSDFDAYINHTNTLHASAAILREALGFYATDKNWDWSLMTNPMLKDSGVRAKRALDHSELGAETLERLRKLETMAKQVSGVLEKPTLPGDANWKALDEAYRAAQDGGDVRTV